MNKVLAVLVLSTSISGPVYAAEQVRVDPPLYTCQGQGLSHVVFVQPPAPCCKGMFGCPQLLSNTGLVKRKHSNRT